MEPFVTIAKGFFLQERNIFKDIHLSMPALRCMVLEHCPKNVVFTKRIYEVCSMFKEIAILVRPLHSAHKIFKGINP
jgi:hypothetical protein